MSLLKADNLKKSFGQKQVLHGVSFTVHDRDFLSLLGPSGCGKTTILRIISGLETPDSGSVTIGGENITQLSPEKRNIGMVFQNYALFPSMNVEKNVGYGLKMRKVPKDEISQRVQDALKLVRLEGYGSRRISQMSGGEQQRIALARALVIQPDILLLDEPLSALDRKIRTEMQYEVRRIQQEVGITTIFVTHDQEEAMTMSDKIILMNDGNIEQHSDPWTMYNRPGSVFASDFLGKSNILGATLRQDKNQWKAIGAGWQLPVEYNGSGKQGDQIKIAVRSEHIIISTQKTKDSLPFLLTDKVFTGVTCKLIGKLGTDTIEVQTIGLQPENYNVGDILHLNIPSNRIIYFHGQ